MGPLELSGERLKLGERGVVIGFLPRLAQPALDEVPVALRPPFSCS
jgi:hypothetical protein